LQSPIITLSIDH